MTDPITELKALAECLQRHGPDLDFERMIEGQSQDLRQGQSQGQRRGQIQSQGLGDDNSEATS